MYNVNEKDLIDNEWFRVHKRAMTHPGTIIDIGCLTWDWSLPFRGKKQIIGFDPLEKNTPSWATLIQKAVSISSGTTKFAVKGLTSGISLCDSDTITVESVSLCSIIATYSPINIIKMNVEGAEFPLLVSVKHPIADQMVVSFHNEQHELQLLLQNYLAKWYWMLRTSKEYNWVLFVLKNEYRNIKYL